MSQRLFLLTPEQLEEVQFQNELGLVKQRSELSHSVTELEFRLRQALDSIRTARRLVENISCSGRNDLRRHLWDAYEILIRYEPGWI